VEIRKSGVDVATKFPLFGTREKEILPLNQARLVFKRNNLLWNGKSLSKNRKSYPFDSSAHLFICPAFHELENPCSKQGKPSLLIPQPIFLIAILNVEKEILVQDKENLLF
jgi:hypothetical protein